MKCTYCGFENGDTYRFCTQCGKPLPNQMNSPDNNNTSMNQNQPPHRQPSNQNYQEFPNNATNSNGIGLAGFVVSIISLFIGWVPFISWVIWLVGLVLSVVGLSKQPRGFAIAGLVISLIGIIIIILMFAFSAWASFWWRY